MLLPATGRLETGDLSFSTLLDDEDLLFATPLCSCWFLSNVKLSSGIGFSIAVHLVHLSVATPSYHSGMPPSIIISFLSLKRFICRSLVDPTVNSEKNL